MRAHTFFVLILSVLILFGCSEGLKVKRIKLAHGLDVTHPVHKGMVFLSQRVSEMSEGRMIIDIYPSQQLGTERQCLELLQIGSLGMTKVSAAVLENFAPDLKVFGIPYIFRDIEHAHMVYDGPVGKELLLEGEKYWLRGLCFYDAGSRSFYTKNGPILSPDDLKGLKIRVQESVTAIEMIKNLGGAPTPISWGELYTALQQGVVDGAENNPPSFFTSRHYEICGYYSLNEHTTIPDVLLISTVVWNSLSEEEKSILEAAVRESVIYQRDVWNEEEQTALKQVIEAGVEVIYPDKRPFIESTLEMQNEYGDDERLSELIRRINETGK
jgi:tripartite ATP-independent transporter DctP family solute receptor